MEKNPKTSGITKEEQKYMEYFNFLYLIRRIMEKTKVKNKDSYLNPAKITDKIISLEFKGGEVELTCGAESFIKTASESVWDCKNC